MTVTRRTTFAHSTIEPISCIPSSLRRSPYLTSPWGAVDTCWGPTHPTPSCSNTLSMIRDIHCSHKYMVYSNTFGNIFTSVLVTNVFYKIIKVRIPLLTDILEPSGNLKVFLHRVTLIVI